jgi:phosphotriesterase-related protein
MPTVNTVLGPVETADLGFTLSHEHVGTNAAGLRHTYPEFLDREGLLEQSVAAMREAYQAGVRTMVEMSTFDLGRDIGLIQEVSRRSGIQLIAVTGNHLTVPRPFGEVSPDIIARLYIKEIEEGIEGTGIKAGLVKAASDRGGITPPQEVILRAAARTHQRTGVPITTRFCTKYPHHFSSTHLYPRGYITDGVSLLQTTNMSRTLQTNSTHFLSLP